MRMLDLRCPGCGSPSGHDKERCDYCGRPVIITSFSSLGGLGLPDLAKYRQAYADSLTDELDASVAGALGIVLLKLGLYAEAQDSLSSATSLRPENAELHFYSAAAALGGKRPFTAGKGPVLDSERRLKAAISVEPRPIFIWMHAYLAHDYFERKFLNHTPGFRQLKSQATALGVTATDKIQLAEILAVESVDLPNEL